MATVRELRQSDQETDIIKDMLENLCLYLNELDKLAEGDIKINDYKLLILEHYVSQMNDLFMKLASEGRSSDIVFS